MFRAIYQGRRVLVTGHTGFKGSWISTWLSRLGAKVAGFSVDVPTSPANFEILRLEDKIAHHQGDIRDRVALLETFREFEPEIVFHLAANASVPGSVDEPRCDFETNCGGTFVLLDSLRHLAPTARVVFTSSAAIYGEPEHFPIVETTPLLPISPYGASKASAEVECRMFFNVYGIPVVIGRVFNAYGPRIPRFVILDFLRKLHQNPEHLDILGNGEQVRDFAHN